MPDKNAVWFTFGWFVGWPSLVDSLFGSLFGWFLVDQFWLVNSLFGSLFGLFVWFVYLHDIIFGESSLNNLLSK